MVITSTPTKTFEILSIDIHGPMNEVQGYKYILTCICTLTYYFIPIALKKADATDVARGLVNQVFAPYGCPVAICTDKGAVFQGRVLEELVRIFKIKFEISYNGF